MTGKVAWVIGGGSGIGAGSAEALARLGMRVAVSGRRPDRIEQVVAGLATPGMEVVTDVTSTESLHQAHQAVRQELGEVDVLVYSAGTNVTQRFWRNSDADALAGVVDTNLNGAVRAIQEVIGGMRERQDGLILLVSSWAGWRFAPGVGVGYSASKTALAAVAETVNAQERLNGIRATHLCPGEVRTDILNTRPVVPSAAEQELMLTPEDLGSAVAWIAGLPARVCVNELVITPTSNTSYA
ncbi:MAG: SDR family NAD(P)-dependent oxidoreductase [Propionicimonas sp.]|uniref:SDR family oxidoreductase n=1 Tax=Propionicimonas sp. TaxID=1955623 RepID=UPI002B201328|nr:SDR family NAD(P)-dependent oxidoreductase [Propionicimonas sp.]MEA4944388.1 SDR family NAD(P)-dependent oxidoreductase [Propionicimonas sp.]MEA5116710.1 SDR family NAD(P)-dependent oxidoreductase [Propionicimonas sp.]